MRSDATRLRRATIPMMALAMFASGTASAVEIQTGNPDLSVSLDTSIKLSTAWRLKNADPAVAGDPTTAQVNTNDGDLNFDKGLVSARADLLTALNVKYMRAHGLRISGQGWYDTVYHDDTDNPGDQGVNASDTPADTFLSETKKLHGEKFELMDAFVYGNFAPGGKRLGLRAGRFTQLYGESLFFGGNGVAGAQTPLDLAKALSVPNAQFKEVARPIGQVSASLSLTSDVSMGAYYQFEWRKTRLPGVGSYFSFADFAGAGGERLLLGPDIWLHHSDDQTAKDSGQGGVQLKVKAGDAEYGLYAANFHDKMPQFYARPGVNPQSENDIGDYQLVYAEDIRVFGASVSTLLGETNVAMEVSYRDNMALAATGATSILPGDTVSDNGDNPAYPTGNTLHVNASAITVLGASPLWQGASFIGEFAWNRVMSYDKNEETLDPLATRSASAVQFLFQPEYFQVMPGVDLQVPIGVSYGIDGRTAVNGVLFPGEHGGNVNVGLKASLNKIWQGAINYTHYFGPAGAIIQATGSPTLSYNNFHGDRDYIALSIERAF